jgi:DTW domain-containing protein YfiP
VSCANCRFKENLCICSRVKKIDLPFSVSIILNKSEYFRLSNTGRFMPLLSHKIDLRIRGLRASPFCYKKFYDSCSHKKNYVLFPTENAELLSQVKPDILSEISKVNFIIPDGNWAQGAKIAKRLAGLSNFEFIYINASQTSNYKLRYNPDPYRLCTLESVAEVFGQLLGKDSQQKSLELLELINNRVLSLRGLK